MKAGKPIVHALLVLLGFTSIVVFYRDGPWNATRVLGIVLLFPSLVLWATARIQLGGSFSVRPQAKGLVTHGLYSKIRNPIYLFGSLAILGLFVFTGKLRYLWVFAFLVPLQLFRIRKEGKVLQGKFGDAYLEYKRRTWF